MTYNRPDVKVVTGPPAAGKTTYVKKNRARGDLVLDVDLLWRCLGVLPPYERPNELKDVVLSVRRFIIDYCKRPSDLERAWIIATAADPEKRNAYAEKLHADILLLKPTREECKRRLREDEHRQRHLDRHLTLVDQWFANYEPRTGDEVISGDS